MKKRTNATKTGNAGIVALQAYCLANDLIFQGEPREDFGVDCYVEVEIDGSPTHFLVGVQCKAGPSYRRNTRNGTFAISISRDDLAYWSAANIPVIFVYYDVADQTLFWHHVQGVLDGSGNLEDVTHLSFTTANSVERKPLAAYVRQLVLTTPNTGDRIRLFKSPMQVVVNGREELLAAAHTPGLDGGLPFDGPGYSSILGYSEDDRWVLIREVVDRGGLPSEIYVKLFDTREWACMRLPLLTRETDEPEADVVPTGADGEMEIRNAIAHIGFCRPQVLFFDHGIRPERYPDESANTVGFAFGREVFTLAVIGRPEHRALVLENRRFAPPRRSTVLTVPTEPMPYVGDFTGVGYPKGLLGICELAASRSGRLLSIGIITNTDHSCWGSPDVFHVHVTHDQLRRSCIDALIA